VCACLVFLLLGLDRYRRVDLRGFRDGPLVLALSRESLRTARRLENGREVEWDPEARRFEWGASNPREMARMRWFLRDGWGERPHYGTAEMKTMAPSATFLVPLLRPQAIDLTLQMSAPGAGRLDVAWNGQEAGHAEVSSDTREATFRLPAAPGFRGDNLVALHAAPGLVVHRIVLRPVSSPSQ
jgi:hypothetical protein